VDSYCESLWIRLVPASLLRPARPLLPRPLPFCLLPYPPSASPLENAHHFPRWLSHEDFRRYDVGSPFHADRAGHSDRTDHGLHGDRNASRASLTAHDLDSIPFGSWHGLARSLVFPYLRHGTNEDFRWPVDLPCSANSTGHSCGKNGNSPRQAWSLRSADLAPDQGLACSD
jgi:hypothetical protein